MDLASVLKALWPLLVIQIGLQIYALYHLYRHRRTRTLFAGLWALIIVVCEIFGPIFYFLLGSSEEE